MVQMNKRRRKSRDDLAALMPPALFRALNDPNRITILARIAEAGRPLTVGDAAG